ncbi:hypothetical protein D1818_24850 [Aquimarina sp. BL5]|uniref:hypothetical protein n=1 Tax=Aquimarina sp. BL5 TaxID=1714860 RepID=UPI000E537AD8|nr:hypothetical protein [Aquimarina sp. BL5]AXT53887.1 hypothetical protein D1818_24850 [Aquimarina sp. BL5]RKN00848.1 hypothetical protein D7036_18255 [Aquimarina sp. BL5]
MKFFLLFIGLLFGNVATVDITEIRNSCKHAKDSKENVEKFYELTRSANYKGNSVLSAYYGCALTLKASFSEKRGDKISFFKQGKKLIEEAIASDPSNIELRMIRLSVQTSAPRITRYYREIDADKSFLIENIDKVPSLKLKKFIKGFMSTSAAFKK